MSREEASHHDKMYLPYVPEAVSYTKAPYRVPLPYYTRPAADPLVNVRMFTSNNLTERLLRFPGENATHQNIIYPQVRASISTNNSHATRHHLISKRMFPHSKDVLPNFKLPQPSVEPITPYHTASRSLSFPSPMLRPLFSVMGMPAMFNQFNTIDETPSISPLYNIDSNNSQVTNMENYEDYAKNTQLNCGIMLKSSEHTDTSDNRKFVNKNETPMDLTFKH